MTAGYTFVLGNLHGNRGHLLPGRQQKCRRRVQCPDSSPSRVGNEEEIKQWKCSSYDGDKDHQQAEAVTGDHNALSYPSWSLIISPGTSLKFFSYLPIDRGGGGDSE